MSEVDSFHSFTFRAGLNVAALKTTKNVWWS